MSEKTPKNSENITIKEGATAMTFQFPILNSKNYTIWAVKIKGIYNVHGIWEALEPKGEVDEEKISMAIAYLFQALHEELVLQVSQHTNAKDIWEDLKACFVDADRVKEARLQTLESEFEALKMKYSEFLDDFTGKISQIVSKANTLGSTIDNKRLVRKLLGSVPEKYIQIVASIDQFADLNTMQFQEAIGRLKAYEECIKKPNKDEDSHNKLLFIKEDADEKNKERKCEHCGHGSSNLGNFGRGRGIGRWSGKSKVGERIDKSHVRCYKCNEFGHFINDCPKWKKKEEINLSQYEDNEPTLL
ncbi:hypothetical protein E3N88_00572 [Mikania micrantha]|uniref:CCHC-type domain-containing protein n=1 Tax=Mikania micrantha TaxID=192012 RepID=A0A5N6Q067_9ASTR|nr:hypothetical protein E3N88_00572 [Mikania micrantha]